MQVHYVIQGAVLPHCIPHFIPQVHWKFWWEGGNQSLTEISGEGGSSQTKPL